MTKVFLLALSSLALIAPAHAEHQEAYLCAYGDEPEELVISTALGVKGGLYYHDYKWTKNGRRLVFSVKKEVRENYWKNPDSGLSMTDPQGNYWIEFSQISRGSGTIRFGPHDKMGRHPVTTCKVGLPTSARKKAAKFMNDDHY